MTEPIPESIRRAGCDALEELANRMVKGANSLMRHAIRLRLEEPQSHRDALAQLRRYQGFKMPCFEEVGVIEGALLGLTEPESKALTERRRLQKARKDAADRQRAEEIRRAHENPRESALEEAARLRSAVNALRDRARALEAPAVRPQNGNVIAGPWDAGGEARP